MKIRGLVSDRATALVKLGKAEYLDVFSMPDLFHFMQDLGKMAGLQIGKKRQQAVKNLSTAKPCEKKEARQVFEQVEQVYQSYRGMVRQINKTVHPFDGEDHWVEQANVEKGLLHCLTAIGKLAKQLDVNVAVEKASKVLAQISPIAQGVQTWVVQAKTEIQGWADQQIITRAEQLWITQCLMPLAYWQIQLVKTQPKSRNQELRTDYQQRLAHAQNRYEINDLTKQIPPERQDELFCLAYQLAISFQRASSQTEGRNGYLSFINHGNKGISKQRLEVLTVVHNYDIKRDDGSTPAQRLFNKQFPDLFEFLCQNVTGFKEPRRRKHKALKTNGLQH